MAWLETHLLAVAIALALITMCNGQRGSGFYDE